MHYQIHKKKKTFVSIGLQWNKTYLSKEWDPKITSFRPKNNACGRIVQNRTKTKTFNPKFSYTNLMSTRNKRRSDLRLVKVLDRERRLQQEAERQQENKGSVRNLHDFLTPKRQRDSIRYLCNCCIESIRGDCDQHSLVEEEEEEEGILEEETWGDGCTLRIVHSHRPEESTRSWFRWLRRKLWIAGFVAKRETDESQK